MNFELAAVFIGQRAHSQNVNSFSPIFRAINFSKFRPLRPTGRPSDLPPQIIKTHGVPQSLVLWALREESRKDAGR